MEPPAVPADAHGQPDGAPAPGVDHLTRTLSASALRRADPRSAFASAALVAAAIGLLGGEGGLVWLVAGVWTVRAVAGGPIGFAWGLAVVGAGIRWGTLGLGDLEVATRVAGPTVLAGPLAVRAGMVAALVGAVVAEAKAESLLARTWGERAASAIAIASLAPLYCVRGPLQPLSGPAAWWAATAAGLAAVALLSRRAVAPVPGWAPVALTAGGVTIAILAS